MLLTCMASLPCSTTSITRVHCHSPIVLHVHPITADCKPREGRGAHPIQKGGCMCPQRESVAAMDLVAIEPMAPADKLIANPSAIEV